MADIHKSDPFKELTSGIVNTVAKATMKGISGLLKPIHGEHAQNHEKLRCLVHRFVCAAASTLSQNPSITFRFLDRDNDERYTEEHAKFELHGALDEEDCAEKPIDLVVQPWFERRGNEQGLDYGSARLLRKGLVWVCVPDESDQACTTCVPVVESRSVQPLVEVRVRVKQPPHPASSNGLAPCEPQSDKKLSNGNRKLSNPLPPPPAGQLEKALSRPDPPYQQQQFRSPGVQAQNNPQRPFRHSGQNNKRRRTTAPPHRPNQEPRATAASSNNLSQERRAAAAAAVHKGSHDGGHQAKRQKTQSNVKPGERRHNSIPISEDEVDPIRTPTLNERTRSL
jgi:hypothetical protein